MVKPIDITGRRGRKAKPTKVKQLQGNPGKRALNKNEPQPSTDRPEPPEYLTEEALEEWNFLIPQLEEMGLLGTLDKSLLAMLCQSYGRYVEAEEKLKETGTIYRTQKGNITTNPYLWVSNRALEQVLKIAPIFGLGTAYRQRLQGKQEEKDPYEEFLGSG